MSSSEQLEIIYLKLLENNPLTLEELRYLLLVLFQRSGGLGE